MTDDLMTAAADPADTELLGAAPSWLDAAGRETWDALAADLRDRQLLRDAETVAFARYCDYVSLWRGIRDQVRSVGATVTSVSKHGQLDRVSPAFKAMLAIEAALIALEDRYGLTPQARGRIMALRASQGSLLLDNPATPPRDQAPAGDGKVIDFPGIGDVPIRRPA